MANMSDTKEPVQQEDYNLNDDIIDVWAMDFSDPDTWLLQLSQNIADDSIWDSWTWPKNKIEQECNNLQDDKRLIDTRTFTRPKKRSGYSNFESIGETNVFCSSNVWNPWILENIGTKDTYNDDTAIAPNREDHVPSMLRLSTPGMSNLCLVQSPFTSDHENLEPICHAPQSKEIDTFVDLAKTEFNEDIMEISQPSVFYSSIMSVTTDDLSKGIEGRLEVSRQSGIEDSQRLTESMTGMSIADNIYDFNFNDTFAKTSAVSPVLENITYCSPLLDTTFLAGTVIKSKETLNESFNTMTVDRETISENATVRNVLDTEQQNSTFNVHKFDTTFEKTSSPLSLTKIPTDFAFKESVPLDGVLTMMDERVINKTITTACGKSFDKLTEKIDRVNQDETFQINALVDTMPALSSTKSLYDYAPKKFPLSKVSIKVTENIDPVDRGVSLESLDTTFQKPAPKVQRKLKSPNALSRLPQSLQKSNPNLGSYSRKLSNTTMSSGISIFGFNKGVRPSAVRSVESSLTTKRWHTLEKTKSGFEQRLDITRSSMELQAMGSSQSTESIASTLSNHSGPDFDDRLSVRSEGSNTSCSMRTVNIDDFQKTFHMREECIKRRESTRNPDRGLLENNWVPSTNDLPSPILKNDPEAYRRYGNSPGSIDSTLKTSSPLLNAPQSLQNVAVNQTRNTSQYKTGIRPPSNRTWTDRPTSGIPRPRSRIPASTFVRPKTKINHGDKKK